MKLLSRETAQISQRCAGIATMACVHVDSLANRALTPAELGELQDGLRQHLLDVEERLERLATRRVRRKTRLVRRCGPNPGFGRFYAGLIKALKERDAGLALERRLLRQTADTLAWIVLDMEANVILPLYSDATHAIPRAIGLAGNVILARDGNKSNRFFVIENDLTRCIGLGDLTVVPHGRKWSRPLSLEVKSSGILEEGGYADVEVFAVVAEDTDQAKLMAEFREVLGLHTGGLSMPLEVSHPKQAARLLSRGKFLHRLATTPMNRVQDSGEARWDTIGRIVANAMARGSAFEIPEDGVARIAIRRTDGEGDGAARAVHDELSTQGFNSNFEAGSTIDMQSDDALSAIITPIALWRLPLPQRVALLLSQVEFVTVVHPEVWARAMAATGLTFKNDDGEWIVSKEGKEVYIPTLVSERLRLGVLFEGISPQQTAQAIRMAVDKLAKSEAADADSEASPA